MNFSKSIEMASNINGDSDTVAAITGNIVGAFRGSKGIQKNILSLLSNLKELKILSRDLFMQPKNIVNKDKRYPISEEFSNSYTLDNILEISKKKESNTKKYINFLNKIYKKIENFKIIDYQNFLINKNIPQNILKKIIIPTELIANELKDKTDFHKLLNILLNNYDNLIHKENLRGCFADERCSIEDILWTVYEKALKNGNIDELCKRVSYMVYSREYNIKAIIDSIN